MIAPAPGGGPHAVVIGSGFGGLAAAIRLGARGWRVTVLERGEEPGGRAAPFRQDGFTFDAGPTIVTAPFLLDELWALCGERRDVALRALDPFYRLRFEDGSHFDARATQAAMRAEVARLCPADVAGYERFMRLSREACRVGFEELGAEPFGRLSDMLRAAPGLARLRAWESVGTAAHRLFRDERLRVAFSFHPLLIGGHPFRASAIFALISALEQRWGVHWALGGTGALVAGLVRLILGQGGRIRPRSTVRRIEVAAGRVTGVVLEGGERVAADIVVSNADAGHTYRHLLDGTPRRRWTDRRLDRASLSMSLFVWHFGTTSRFDTVGHHTVLMGPRFRPLLDDIFRHRALPRDMAVYLHRPTATDPSVAPPGCDTFYALVPVPHLASGTDWEAEAPRMRARLLARLEATVLPGLARHLASERVVTPLHFRDRLLSPMGAAFSLEPTLMQSAYFRPHNRSEEVGNLFLVGAGTHPGAGLPGVLCSAKVLDKVVPHARAFA